MIDSSSTLFRGSSVATKVLRLLYDTDGRSYLKFLMQNVIQDAMEDTEIDFGDDDFLHDSEIIEGNGDQIWTQTMQILKNIVNSYDSVPDKMKWFYYLSWKYTELKFPDFAEINVGCLYILRFICPALIIPDQQGLCNEPPSPAVRRSLVLSGKILQSMATTKTFNMLKNPALTYFNPLMESEKPTLSKFITQIGTQPPPMNTPNSTDYNPVHLNTLAKHISLNN